MTTLKDLKANKNPSASLYCGKCREHYSAHPSDYFLCEDDHVFKCHGRPMRLVVREVVIRALLAFGLLFSFSAQAQQAPAQRQDVAARVGETYQPRSPSVRTVGHRRCVTTHEAGKADVVRCGL